VLSGIKQRLLAPELVADFVRAYGEELADAEREAARVRLHAEAELADVGRRLKGVLSAIEAGAFDETLRGRLDGLESRKAEIEAAIRMTVEAAPPARLHPTSAELYQARVAGLEAALNDPEIRMEAAEALRGCSIASHSHPTRRLPTGYGSSCTESSRRSWRWGAASAEPDKRTPADGCSRAWIVGGCGDTLPPIPNTISRPLMPTETPLSR
jgi:site-specific DNA recombinase